MNWTILLVVCVALCSSSMSCVGTRLDDFLQEKHDFLQEVDRLFYTYYYNKASHQHSHEPHTNVNLNEQLEVSHHSPLASPDWSPTTDYFHEADDSDENMATLISNIEDFATEVDNYRPRDDGSGGPFRSERKEPSLVFDGSGDNDGTDPSVSPGDDEEQYEDSGSGDSTPDETTTAAPHLETSTSIPVEATTSVYHQCGAHLKSEIKSCVELSLSLRTLLYEMGLNFVQTGYYNVSSNDYLFHLFRTCISAIDIPPRCIVADGNDNILDVVTHRLIAFANVKDNVHIDEAIFEESSFTCFSAHLYSLRSCLALRLDNQDLENLVKIVILKPDEVLNGECQAFREVRDCLVWSMRRCEDSNSVVLVEDMFETTMRSIAPCSPPSGAAEITSLGAVITLTISILIARF